MAHRSQCSSAADNPLDPNYLPPHYREEYRLAIDALVENDLEGYYEFLQNADVVDFLSKQEAEYIKHTTQEPKQSTQPAQCAPEQYMDEGGEGSSDTYWPMHSDLDAPDLDLGWPEQHRFIGPTEVTTLVNPSEPDMPSIKEHARRLIKNSHQLVAVVMDMFTDVDIFADILDAAGRNVAVYILLDEHNVHHFTNMVSNCRVNLENFPFMRVRTVSGLTYYCRTGKSFKGQMMNRFLLTDCRAVLSGNYSFMWSFEKIHRCIAHLFLGQLVTTFDEEFRILYAQSSPLFENVLAPVPDFNSLSDRLSSTNQTPLFRDPRKVLPIENTGSMEWARHSFDERVYVDQKQMAFRKHELFHRSLDQGQLEMYNSSQHLRMDPSLIEQGPSLNLSEFKRRNSAQGIHVRVPSYRFMQHQQMVGFETQGRQMEREPQKENLLYQRAGPDPSYAGYDKFRGYGYRSMDQYSHSDYPPEMDPEPYDPVLNYLSSTSIDMKDDSAKATSGEISLGLSNPNRISIGQPLACQHASTQMASEDNEFFQGPNIDHETPDLRAKQGMRDWRIHSYLNAFNNAGDEDLSMQSPTGSDPLEEPLKHAQVGSSGPVLPDSMFHTKELPKFQTTSKLRKLQCYTKSVIPEVKKVPDTVITMASEVDTTPSESSLTAEEDKTEVVGVKEPKEIGVKREEYFHKTYNAAVQRSSRLKSSLIFSSQLEQHFSDMQTTSGQHDEEMNKNEKDQSKLPFSTPLLVKRRSFTREPFEWSRYIKPVGTDSTITESSKSDDLVPDTGVSEDPSDDKEIKKQPTPTEVEQNVLTNVKTEQLTHSTNQFSSSMTNIDMSDPDCRLMFFKELAAQRKAEKNTPLVNITKKACIKTDHSVPTSDQRTETTCQKIEPGQSEVPQTPLSQEIKSKMSTVTCGQSHRKAKEAFKSEEQDSNLPKNVFQPFNREDISSNEGVLSGSTDAEKIELKRNQIISEIKEKEPTTSDSTLVCSNPIEGTVKDYTPALNEPSLSVLPQTDNLFTPDSSPQCVPGTKQCPPTVPSESGTSTLSIPLESCQSAGHDESVLSKNPEETKPNESQSYLPVKTSFKTKKENCSSSTPPHTKCASAPKPSLATLESSSTHSAPSSTSSILHPDPSKTSLTHPFAPETSLNPHPSTAETSSTPHPAPSAASLSPHPVTTGTSSTVNSFSSSISSNSHPDLPKASLTPPPVLSLTSFSSPCQENTPESQIQNSFLSESEIESPCTATESCSSPESHSGSVLLASSEIEKTNVTTAKISSTPDKFSSFSDLTSTESCESSFPTDIESCSSSTQANSTSPVNPIVAEFNLIPNCTSVEPRTPNLSIVENSSLNKEPLSELCEESKPQTSSEKFVCHESQVDEANVTLPASESVSDQVIPMSSQSKNSKVSQSRLQSSTTKVLSNSNLRDDTKLLLEQISFNSQSRAELAKETAVTDDAKKEEAHRVGNAEERIPERSQSSRQHRTDQERQSLLQRIKSLRKEKKVYSRFEVSSVPLKKNT